MNLEQLLAGSTFCIGLGVLVGVIANWWSRRSDIKQMEVWEAELTGREQAVQQERIQTQLTRSEAQMLHEEATKLRRGAEELAKGVRRQLYGMAADAAELGDETASTRLIDIDPITDDTLHRTIWFDVDEDDDTVVQ